MKRYVGGAKVEDGYYWNQNAWSIHSVDGEGDRLLPGGADDKYNRLPLLVMAVVAVVVSFGFVMFLPFIGFALLAYALTRGLTGLVRRERKPLATRPLAK